jgi:hypothetical protein
MRESGVDAHKHRIFTIQLEIFPGARYSGVDSALYFIASAIGTALAFAVLYRTRITPVAVMPRSGRCRGCCTLIRGN